MTAHKHFKSRVRERMQKTGESYSAARMHLAARRDSGLRDAGTPGLAPGYPALTPLTQYNAGLWQRVLTQAGTTHPASSQPLSEAFLAGLAGGIGFMVYTFEYQRVTTATVVTRFHPGPFVDNLLDRSGAHIDRRTTSSEKVSRATLDDAVEQGRAVMVRVTRGALPWFSDASEFSDSVDVVVAGKDGDHYLIDDGAASFRRITPAALAAARRRRTADKHWQASIADPGELTSDTLATAVREAVGQTAGVLLGRGGLHGIPAHATRNFGAAGMRTWAERLQDTRTKKGWPAMFASEDRLRPALRQVKHFLAGNEWAGPGGLRPLYAQFLLEAAELGGLERLRDAVAGYNSLGTAWTGFANLIDPGCPVDSRIDHFAALAEQLERLAQAEETAAESLQAALG